MAFTTLRGVRVIVQQTKRVEGTVQRPAASGEVVLADKTRLLVACGEGVVELARVQQEGRKVVSGGDWFLGRGVREGDVLGS